MSIRKFLIEEGIDPDSEKAQFLNAIYGQESGRGANARTSNHGAVGGMQIMPGTFRAVADKGWDIRNPEHNARAGIRYGSRLFDDYGPERAAVGYYSGDGGVEAYDRGVYYRDKKNPNAPDTKEYAASVLDRMSSGGGGGGGGGYADISQEEWDAIPVNRGRDAPADAPVAADTPADDPYATISQDEWDAIPVNNSQKPPVAAPVATDTPVDDPYAPISEDQWATEFAPVAAPAPASVAAPDQSNTSNIAERFLHGAAEPIYGAAQAADKLITQPLVKLGEKVGLPASFLADSQGVERSTMDDVMAREEALKPKVEGFDWVGLAGNMVNPLSWVAPGVKAGQAIANVGRVLGGGALQGVMTPEASGEDYITEKLKSMAMGAGGAALGHAVGGVPVTKEARQLMDENIQPTVGQAMGKVPNEWEQKFMSIPLIGDLISNARGRPLKEFEANVINKAVGGAVDDTGAKITNLARANEHVSDLYDEVMPHLKPTQEAATNATTALRSALLNPELNKAERDRLKGIFKSKFEGYPSLDGPGIKRLDAELGHMVRTYQKSPNAADKVFGNELANIHHAFREGLDVGLPPEYAAKLKAANNGYKQLIAINKAAMSRADEAVMPRKLQIERHKQQNKRVIKEERGVDGLVRAAARVLPQTVPDSGTAGRAALASVAGIGAFINPSFAAAAIPLFGGASRMGQKAMTGGYGLQDPLAEILRRMGGAVGPRTDSEY